MSRARRNNAKVTVFFPQEKKILLGEIPNYLTYSFNFFFLVRISKFLPQSIGLATLFFYMALTVKSENTILLLGATKGKCFGNSRAAGNFPFFMFFTKSFI